MPILDEFFANDVSVADAAIHLYADLDRAALLEARVKATAATLQRARDLLAGVPSALAREAFLARPLTRRGKHEEALAARLEALRFTPRWDPFQSGVVLSGLSRSLLAVGRAEEAASVAREATRHAPLDPWAVRAWADATRASGGLSARTEAAVVAAWLRHQGYGAPIVEGAPTAEEALVEPAPPPLDDLAPLDVEGMARFLTLAEVEEGFESKRYRFVRHAMALMRHGEPGLARNVAAGDDGDSGLATVLACWLNLAPPDEIAWLAKRSIRRALDATKAGAEARSGANAKKANRLWSYDAISHIGYRGQLLKTGRKEDGEALLFSPARAAFVDALASLPNHPVVARFEALRASLLAAFPPALPNQSNRGASATLGSDGEPVRFPMHETIDRAEMPPCIELMEDARSSCKVCKARIAKDTTALAFGRISATDGEPKRGHGHLACAAADPKLRAALLQAIAREPRLSAELAEIARQLGAEK